MKPEQFINRELSWLAFNERVLEEAERESLPLLERLKFLAITASNLDEFFMVRVGGLQLMKDRGQRVKDPSGMTPSQQLEAIRKRTLIFVERQYALLREKILPGLEKCGLRRMRPGDLSADQRAQLEDYFLGQIYPILSPIAVDEEDPRKTQVPALQIGLIAEVETIVAPVEKRHVLLTLPASLTRHVPVLQVEGAGHAYVLLEDLVEMFLPHHYFPHDRVLSTARFRISRNSDIAVDDESALDLASEMEQILEARTTSATIRLEIQQGASRALSRVIQNVSGASTAQIYVTPDELDLRTYFSIASMEGFDALKTTPWPISDSPRIEAGESIFDAIREGDILLHHPYESFEPVLQLIEEAANDPNVVAIKQILYRTAKNSRIISSLIKAAEAGKHVTVLVELKARFDEARNLDRAEDLLNAGAQIIYGVRGLKTHAKICLVVRRESGRLARYVHFGTGNYNEATAKLYTDISVLTCKEDYGADASLFFNTITGRSRFVHFRKISMAPYGLRERLLELIRSEAARAKQGDTGKILLKMNSLEDPVMIQALYDASQAGVEILLSVRGICCLRPGVKGVSQNIRVFSVIDRYLEHGRVYWFRQGGDPVVYIASADFMTRNLTKRVELLVPVEEPAAKQRLQEILESLFEDESQARELKSDGEYHLLKRTGKAFRAQEEFARQAARYSHAKSGPPDVLVPHRPAKPQG